MQMTLPLPTLRTMRTAAMPALLAIVAFSLCAGPSGATATRSARPQPGNGAILFTSGRDGAPALYTVNGDGSSLRRIVATPSRWGDLTAAQWSPDGTKIAFLGSTSGLTDLYVVRSNGGRLRRLGLEGDVHGFSWSPDSKTIAYGSHSNNGISVVGVDGRRPTRLTTAPKGMRDEAPVWSPRGSRVAFLRSGPSCCGGLWVVNADGSSARRLTSSASSPSWSPDGRRLVFIKSEPLPNGYGRPGVFVTHPDGTGTRRIVWGFFLPAWSPRGDSIALSGAPEGEEYGLFLVRPSGRGLRKISDFSGGQPAWSPDGTKIAITSSFVKADVEVVDAGGGPSRAVTQGWRYGYSNVSPQWNPDGLRTEQLGGTPVSPAVPSDSVASGETLKTRQPIDRLVADGSRVVAEYRGPQSSCVESWDPVARSLDRYLAGRCDIRDLASAGDRIAWVTYDGGGKGTALATVTSSERSPTLISGVCDPGQGPSIPCYRLPMFDLSGDGPILVFDTWGGQCNDWVLCLGEPKLGGRLWRLDGTHAVEIASSAKGLTPLSVDRGRILVDHGEGLLEVLAADGASLGTFRLNGALVRAARLQGRDLVVLTPAALEVSDVETGQFLHRWPTPTADAQLVDVQDQIAVLVAGRDIHLLRLSDGRDTVVEAPGTGPVLAQLEPSGLFYSYESDDKSYPGRIEFVSFDQLPLR